MSTPTPPPQPDVVVTVIRNNKRPLEVSQGDSRSSAGAEIDSANRYGDDLAPNFFAPRPKTSPASALRSGTDSDADADADADSDMDTPAEATTATQAQVQVQTDVGFSGEVSEETKAADTRRTYALCLSQDAAVSYRLKRDVARVAYFNACRTILPRLVNPKLDTITGGDFATRLYLLHDLLLVSTFEGMPHTHVLVPLDTEEAALSDNDANLRRRYSKLFGEFPGPNKDDLSAFLWALAATWKSVDVEEFEAVLPETDVRGFMRAGYVVFVHQLFACEDFASNLDLTKRLAEISESLQPRGFWPWLSARIAEYTEKEEASRVALALQDAARMAALAAHVEAVKRGASYRRAEKEAKKLRTATGGTCADFPQTVEFEPLGEGSKNGALGPFAASAPSEGKLVNKLWDFSRVLYPPLDSLACNECCSCVGLDITNSKHLRRNISVCGKLKLLDWHVTCDGKRELSIVSRGSSIKALSDLMDTKVREEDPLYLDAFFYTLRRDADDAVFLRKIEEVADSEVNFDFTARRIDVSLCAQPHAELSQAASSALSQTVVRLLKKNLHASLPVLNTVSLGLELSIGNYLELSLPGLFFLSANDGNDGVGAGGAAEVNVQVKLCPSVRHHGSWPIYNKGLKALRFTHHEKMAKVEGSLGGGAGSNSIIALEIVGATTDQHKPVAMDAAIAEQYFSPMMEVISVQRMKFRMPAKVAAKPWVLRALDLTGSDVSMDKVTVSGGAPLDVALLDFVSADENTRNWLLKVIPPRLQHLSINSQMFSSLASRGWPTTVTHCVQFHWTSTSETAPWQVVGDYCRELLLFDSAPGVSRLCRDSGARDALYRMRTKKLVDLSGFVDESWIDLLASPGFLGRQALETLEFRLPTTRLSDAVFDKLVRLLLSLSKLQRLVVHNLPLGRASELAARFPRVDLGVMQLDTEISSQASVYNIETRSRTGRLELLDPRFDAVSCVSGEPLDTVSSMEFRQRVTCSWQMVHDRTPTSRSAEPAESSSPLAPSGRVVEIDGVIIPID